MKAMAIMSNPKTMESFVRSGEVSSIKSYFFEPPISFTMSHSLKKVQDIYDDIDALFLQ